MIDFKAFVKWQQEKPRRHVKIELGSPSSSTHREIWVYDYDLEEGQHVESVEEINLEEKIRQRLQENIDRLKRLGAKIGGTGGENLDYNQQI